MTLHRRSSIAGAAVLAIVLTGALVGSQAWAQPCPHNAAAPLGRGATAMGYGTGAAPTAVFVAGFGMNCSGSPFGAATACTQVNYGVNLFRAQWPSATARISDSTGGCQFMCPGGTCNVKNDGLPIELLGFRVE